MKLIINPSAGKGKAKRKLNKIKSFFKKHNIKLEITNYKQLKKIKNQTIIVAGGDGTINKVINNTNLSNTLAIIPLGTANVFAREHKIPKNIIKACNVIKNNKKTKIDLGKVDNNLFALWFGANFDAEIIKRVRTKLKNINNAIAYILAGIEALITAKKNKIIIVSNAKYYAFSKLFKKRKGKLTLMTIKDNILTRLNYALNIITFGIIPIYGKRTYAQTLTLNINPPYQIDGEYINQKPKEIKILKNALKIIVP